MDEPLGGYTIRGTPVAFRTKECFPAESRDLFWEMDKVASGINGALEPLNFDSDGDGLISDTERDAIRGRNTWILWGAGNEAFWGWFTENGFGLSDSMIMLDSRKRESRFQEMGVMNQPGFAANHNAQKRILGLYFDSPINGEGEKSSAILAQNPNDLDSSGNLAQRAMSPTNHPVALFPTEGAFAPAWNIATGEIKKDAFGNSLPDEPVDVLIKVVVEALPKDGLDYNVYGYPTGIIGLRMMLNPDFFGNTQEADEARRHWQKQVLQTNDQYYTDPRLNHDPTLVRPFRVSMSCGYCHVGPHPLNPPTDVNNPKWENLSSIIGSQYWKSRGAVGNLPKADNILHHFLASQEPGAVDTSGFSQDQINNPNRINGVFEVHARLTRANLNPKELQSVDNLRVPNIEDGLPAQLNTTAPQARNVARVLMDGSDSIGTFGALSRVFLNIGTFPEYWLTRSNLLIGMTRQKPFDIKTCQTNSVFWMTNQEFRINYLAEFFEFTRPSTVARSANVTTNTNGTFKIPAVQAATNSAQSSTAPMKLKNAQLPDGKTLDQRIAGTKDQRVAGRKVWLNNCAICHSSKQPDGFELAFQRDIQWRDSLENIDWSKASAPDSTSALYTLPMDGAQWKAFKSSDSYRDYLKKLKACVGAPELLEADPWTTDHPFWVDNFLSTDIRVPVTLVGTNSARALATNSLRGDVWDNFSSDTYKSLPSVGDIEFYNPFKPLEKGRNTNDHFTAPAGGVGYYRPPSLVSVWATAPLLHNNTLGYYNEDPSVTGRLWAFEDAIRRLLWSNLRADSKLQIHPLPPQLTDARNKRLGDLRHDDSSGPAANDPGYIYRFPQDTYATFQAPFVRPLLEGVVGPFVTNILAFWGWAVTILALSFIYVYAAKRRVRSGSSTFLLRAIITPLLICTVVGGWTANRFINGKTMLSIPFFNINIEPLPIEIGPFPEGMPMNLVMNLNPDSPNIVQAVTSLLVALATIHKNNLHGEAAYEVIHRDAGAALMSASKCPDFVLDHGHLFGETLTDQNGRELPEQEMNSAKEDLIQFLKTL